ncbi:MAG: hypothetical protein IJ840_06220 [Bacteroidales bacterium]|nr:hypothetical protein [Bacteroidales bacterium]
MRQEIDAMRKEYFHMCANGADARNFIIREQDYYAAFNLIAVCAATTEAVVVSFSVEDSHPHVLLWGLKEDCSVFKVRYENLYTHYAASTREGGADLVLRCELYPIGDDLDYLRNVAVYTIIQPTKDGKSVMPYDYLWGTGSLYFRSGFYTPVWLFDKQGSICHPVPFGSLRVRERRELLHSRNYPVPDEWLVCNGFILPENYIDVARFESIYTTFNRFRVFLSSPKKREEMMLAKMAEERGVMLEDLEARRVCGDQCKQLFGTRDPRRLIPHDRLLLAQQLRRQFRLSFRQIATLVRLPETEVRSFVR